MIIMHTKKTKPAMAIENIYISRINEPSEKNMGIVASLLICLEN
jgi:hypothetical protein